MISDPRLFVMVPPDGRRNHPSNGLAYLEREPFGLCRRFCIPGAGRATDGEFQIVQIVVRDNNVDQALKALKKKMQREGLFREMKRRDHFEKPSERKAREKAEAVRRARKLARKRAQREGLLPKT
jgi:small subunit ribosomal protein S21